MELGQAKFQRGQTFGGGFLTLAGTDGQDIEGSDKYFEDINVTTSPPLRRSNSLVKCRAVRNFTSGSLTSATGSIALLPKRIAQCDLANNSRAIGYTTVDGGRGFPIDEFLPAAGVVNWDLFWVVLAGPAMVLTPLDGGADNVINADDVLTSLTAATSQATTAGHVKTAVWTGATAVLAVEIAHIIGTALSTKTTANTNANLLIDVWNRYGR
jgi:hypothetical protein